MAKKSKLQKLRKDKRFLKTFPLLTLLLGVAVGAVLVWLQPPDLYPKNLVWAGDATVKIPSDLVEFLRNQPACKRTSGSDGRNGVGLWGVYQVSQAKFAKVSYGCSSTLTPYLMAVRDHGKWLLIPYADYFADQSISARFLPKCTYIDKYKIDSSIEPFCLEASGAARENNIK